MHSVLNDLSPQFIMAEEMVMSGTEEPTQSFGIQILFALLAYILPWLALIITGTIFDRFQEGEPATMWENAQAALVIIGCTALVNILSIFLPLSPLLGVIVYWGLIYYAFQLENIGDLFIFIILHGAILSVINLFITLPMLNGMRGIG